MAKKVAALSATAVEILEVLKSAEKPMTLAEIKEVVPTANSAHLTALRNRSKVGAVEVEKEIVTVSKRKVLEYNVAEDTNEPAETDAE